MELVRIGDRMGIKSKYNGGATLVVDSKGCCNNDCQGLGTGHANNNVESQNMAVSLPFLSIMGRRNFLHVTYS
jgi:hypothetical protein